MEDSRDARPGVRIHCIFLRSGPILALENLESEEYLGNTIPDVFFWIAGRQAEVSGSRNAPVIDLNHFRAALRDAGACEQTTPPCFRAFVNPAMSVVYGGLLASWWSGLASDDYAVATMKNRLQPVSTCIFPSIANHRPSRPEFLVILACFWRGSPGSPPA